jgi:hypothetical protein
VSASSKEVLASQVLRCLLEALQHLPRESLAGDPGLYSLIERGELAQDYLVEVAGDVAGQTPSDMPKVRHDHWQRLAGECRRIELPTMHR